MYIYRAILRVFDHGYWASNSCSHDSLYYAGSPGVAVCCSVVWLVVAVRCRVLQ